MQWRHLPRIGAALWALQLVGCAVQERQAAQDNCLDALQRLESTAGPAPGELRPVLSQPTLASNRLLASFDPRTLDSQQRDDWLARLQRAGEQRRNFLFQQAAINGAPWPQDAQSRLHDCAAQQLVPAKTARQWQQLHAATQIPDDYSTARRVLGVYPLMSLGLSAGIENLQRELLEDFARTPRELAVRGRLRRYLPTMPAQVSEQDYRSPAELPRDNLGVLLAAADPSRMGYLLGRHAPILEIDDNGAFDWPGAPYFDADAIPRVSSESAVGYRYLSVMPFAGALRLQLNYLFWFDARPPEGAFDTLAGRLDGLHWRVTLDEQGNVLTYDSIHPCGCYQQFFPSARLALRPGSDALPEPPLVPVPAPELGPGDRPVLRLSSGRHYLQAVYASSGSSVAGTPVPTPYQLSDYQALYRVPGPDGKQSLFSEHGLVAGTERAERLYLWPSGIRSPGAMRERGRHATAFLGRRHFDDADLLDRLFRLGDSSPDAGG